MKQKIQVGDRVVMPSPDATDLWLFGGFVGRVADILDDGMAIVEDQDSDFFTVESERLQLAKD